MRLRLVFVKIWRTVYLIKNISITQLEKNAPSGHFLSEIEEIFRRNIEYLRESDITSRETPTFPSSMAEICERSTSTSSASCSCVYFFRLR